MPWYRKSLCTSFVHVHKNQWRYSIYILLASFLTWIPCKLAEIFLHTIWMPVAFMLSHSICNSSRTMWWCDERNSIENQNYLLNNTKIRYLYVLVWKHTKKKKNDKQSQRECGKSSGLNAFWIECIIWKYKQVTNR